MSGCRTLHAIQSASPAGIKMQLLQISTRKSDIKGDPFFKLVRPDYSDPLDAEAQYTIGEAGLPVAFKAIDPDRGSSMTGGIIVSPSLRQTIFDFNRYVAEELKKDDPQPPIVLKGIIGTQFALGIKNDRIKTDEFTVTEVIDFDKYLTTFLKLIHGWDSWEHIIERNGVSPGSNAQAPPQSSYDEDDDDDDDDEDWESDDDDDDRW